MISLLRTVCVQRNGHTAYNANNLGALHLENKEKIELKMHTAALAYRIYSVYTTHRHTTVYFYVFQAIFAPLPLCRPLHPPHLLVFFFFFWVKTLFGLS